MKVAFMTNEFTALTNYTLHEDKGQTMNHGFSWTN